MYMALDSGLPAGGSMVVDFSELTDTSMAACNLYPLTTTLDASTYLAADLVAGGSVVADGQEFTCSWTEDLAANTPYALVISDATGQT